MQRILFSSLLGFVTLYLCISCDSKQQSKGAVSLMKFGIPVELSAPKDVELSQVGKGNLTHVAVKNSAGYDIQVFMTTAVSQDLTWLKQQKKEMITAHPNFTKIVEETNEGFIYEKTESDGTLSYDFVHVKLQGDKEISYMGGNSSVFTEKDVKEMISSIR